MTKFGRSASLAGYAPLQFVIARSEPRPSRKASTGTANTASTMMVTTNTRTIRECPPALFWRPLVAARARLAGNSA